MILDDDESRAKKIIYVVRKGRMRELSMPDCFGRLNDKVAADVVRWLTAENIVTSATVVKIMGGTAKRPKLTAALELRTYPGPKEKKQP